VISRGPGPCLDERMTALEELEPRASRDRLAALAEESAVRP
jgi:hypothetical protein